MQRLIRRRPSPLDVASPTVAESEAESDPGPRHARIPQLDGLRGVAILLVVFAHAWNGVYPARNRLIGRVAVGVVSGGGLFGVRLFFVLSGFLITSILLREHERTGTVGLRAFYGRRARRLLPALLLVAGAYAAYAVIATSGHERTQALGSVFRAVTYVEDLKPLISSIPTSDFLGHTWSLAVEEQFYLAWPLALLVTASRWGRRGVATTAIMVIVATVLGRHLLVYRSVGIGNLMEWDALMLGCLLAVRPFRPARWLGAAAWVVLGASLFVWPRSPTWPLTVSAAACGVALMHAFRCQWLTHPVLRYFGRISYGLYLWHALLLRFDISVPLALALSVAVADVSFRFIESPFLRRSPGQGSGDLRASPRHTIAPAPEVPG